MDVNAGEYLDGKSMEECGARLVDLTLAVAGGQKTMGEKAGHSQVSIWRNWALAQGQTLQDVQAEAALCAPTGEALQLAEQAEAAAASPPGTSSLRELSCLKHPNGQVSLDSVAVILPTSLCSSQVAPSLSLSLSPCLPSTNPLSAPLRWPPRLPTSSMRRWRVRKQQ